MPACKARPISSTVVALPSASAVRMTLSADPEAGTNHRAGIGKAVGRLAGQQRLASIFRHILVGEQRSYRVPLRWVRRRTNEQAGIEPAFDKCRRAVEPTWRIAVFSDLTAGKKSLGKGAPVGRRFVAGEQIAEPLVTVTRDHQASGGSATGSRANSASRENLYVRRDRRRRRLVLRLAGNGSVNGATSAPTRAAGAVSPRSSGSARTAMPRCWPLADDDLEHTLPYGGRQPREAAVNHADLGRIVGMHLDERLRQMLAQPRTQAGARHGVPLVADAAGVEPQRPSAVGLGSCSARHLRRDEAAPCGRWRRNRPRRRSARAAAPSGRHRPLHRRHRVERASSDSASARRYRNRASPSFSNAESAACSRNTSAADW